MTTPAGPRRPWLGWYKTAAWQAIRRAQLAHSPLCEECLAIGKTTPATDVHHKDAHKGDPEKFWAGPFASSCASCHSRFGQREDHGRAAMRFDANGWPM